LLLAEEAEVMARRAREEEEPLLRALGEEALSLPA
jgi:hypothetical protein